MPAPFPPVLTEIAAFLRDHSHLPLVETGNSRQDSAQSEERILALLMNDRFPIESANIGQRTNTHWHDAKADGRHYIDIKISRLAGADNTNAKKAVYYFLTGDDPTNVPNRDNRFFPMLEEKIRENRRSSEERDFYYLIVGKGKTANDPLRAFVTSFRTMRELRSTANNMPFQCDWRQCAQPAVRRNYAQTKDFLLGAWAQSVKKAHEKYRHMPVYFPEYFTEDNDG